MKKTLKIAAFMIMMIAALAVPAAASVGRSSAYPRITVMLKTGGTFKNRVISSDACIEIVSRKGETVLDSRMLLYTSTNEEIASVDRNGLITTGEQGTCEITVSTRDGLRKAVIRVTVRDHILSLSSGERTGSGKEKDGKTSVWSKDGGDDFF